MDENQQDFYQSMRRRIRAWLQDKGRAYAYADVLLVAPDLFHLLCKLAADARVPTVQKIQLTAAIAYFVSPLDLIPEGIVGPVGYIDDIALAAYVLNRLVNAGHGALAQEHWAGDGDLLSTLQRILEIADAAVGTGLWNKLKRLGHP